MGGEYSFFNIKLAAKRIMSLIKWFKTRLSRPTGSETTIKWYPGNNSSVRKDPAKIHPSQLPPLMVRKPAWRK